jgi:hypothetical protein
MVNSFSKTCGFFLRDKPLFKTKHQKYAYPATNHLLAYHYASTLDQVLSWSNLDKESKPVSQIYHKMLVYTFRHILHKYKRIKNEAQTHKVHVIQDFYTGESTHINYCDYPLTEDLAALKKELGRLTPARIDSFNEVEDKHLDYLNIGALSDFSLYSFREFKRDFDVVNEMWLDLVMFAKEKHESEQVLLISHDKKNKRLS